MKTALIIAAPFGFGPSSKALIIAEYLKDDYSVSIASSGNAVEFLRRNVSPNIRIFSGLFRRIFPSRETLNGFDAFIAINHVPALIHLTELGVAKRSVFIDSIAQWRADTEPVRFPDELLAHIVQDELGEQPAASPVAADHTIVTAPLLWPDDTVLTTNERKGILIHTGGIASPAVGAELVSTVTSTVIGPIVESVARHVQDVTLLGNAAALRDLPRINVTTLGSVSPARAIREIGRAKLLITTPGIGAIYEAMSKKTPIILLPPMNSTQLRHYRVLTRLGILGMLGEKSRDELWNHLKTMPWQHQATALMKILSANGPFLTRRVEAILAPLITAEGNPLLVAYQQTMGKLWGMLSQVSPRDAIRSALDQVRP